MKLKSTVLKKAILLGFSGLLFYACDPEEPSNTAKPENVVKVKTTPAIFYSLVKKHPHDTTAFTEGFLFHEGKLFESTGAPEYLSQARSSFGIVDLEKGKLDIKAELDKKIYFGEGIVFFKDKMYQLTYQNQTGFIYDAKTYKKTGQFNYTNKEGWGMTTDGKSIIMSDGTFNLTYLDPTTLTATKTLPVTENGYGLDHINELEYINGFIYANVWMSSTIVKINPENGEVVGKLEFSDLYSESKQVYPKSLEMNGIAYDSISDKILVTGKLWPYIYEVSFPH